MIQLTGSTPERNQSSTSAGHGHSARDGQQPEALQATVVGPAEQPDFWAVRVEIVQSRPPSGGAGAAARPTRVVEASSSGVATSYVSNAQQAAFASGASLAAASASGNASQLTAAVRFDAADPRRAAAAYTALGKASERASADTMPPRLRVRA